MSDRQRGDVGWPGAFAITAGWLIAPGIVGVLVRHFLHGVVASALVTVAALWICVGGVIGLLVWLDRRDGPS